ncbi:MAG: 23S rRNA (pseudouridine(1915)-N(3))-methyltransferase RlmH [Ferruginibacter sp.]|nr:23S rRNA (pseudouridine(1915)-N(3))-methyltransferase RlmH [Ferruginibacter sp.]
MKIQLWSIGKPHEDFVKQGIEIFTKRVTNYFAIEWKIIPMPKNAGIMEPDILKIKEGETIITLLQKDDYLVLLDETGKIFSSEKFSQFLEQRMADSTKNVVFLIGGAFGVSDVVKKRANFTWSLSSLVFPHQLVRLILAEQIYRACSIMRNEKYHHV